MPEKVDIHVITFRAYELNQRLSMDSRTSWRMFWHTISTLNLSSALILPFTSNSLMNVVRSVHQTAVVRSSLPVMSGSLWAVKVP